MNKTKIEWCNFTWNPVTGCLHTCEYCYARRIANRFDAKAIDGNPLPGGLHILEDKLKSTPFPFGFEPALHRYRLDEPQKQTKPCTIFVCSMADLFGEWVPDEWIEAVFAACKKAPQHRYLFLTKNPQRYIELERRFMLPHSNNMWYGTTATNNEQFSKAVNSFGKLSSKTKTFLSVEPILENINAVGVRTPKKGFCALAFIFGWVIIGAETGNSKNKVIPEKAWIDSICNAADETEIPVFMKDSLIPIVGEENMRREFPWER
ncbi:MAG: phage Gp37/Gp68 family protein [Oscillospiraceae bacterium]|nr:phage Gp37/Gp68 family protein [Oscillospiraceae bacterium]